MAGALAERDFADKLVRAGFAAVEIGGHTPVGIDDLARYPLFTPQLVALMRATIPPARHATVATSVVARARKPAG